MFSHTEERLVDPLQQWDCLMNVPNKSARFLSAPTAFLWIRRRQLTRLNSGEGPKVFIYKRTMPTNDLPWDLISELAQNYQIFIRGDSIPICKEVSKFLNSINVAHKMFHGRKEQDVRLRMINDFNNGNIHVLIASNVAAMGLHFANRLFTVYPHVPDPKES
jgi:superfamily II DNA/RNA helicase